MTMTEAKQTTASELIDVRDVIARYEHLESIRDNEGGTFNEWMTYEQKSELIVLRDLLASLEGNGGDEQWRGRWYPVTLVREDYFTEYSRELVEECGYISKDFPWWIVVDWDATAKNVRMDYTSVEFKGQTYWTR